MKKKLLILSLITLILSFKSVAQNTEYGRWATNKGTLRVLYVFAEVIDDPAYSSINEPNWQAGQMPNNPNDYFDNEFTSAENIHGFMTDYFYQASCGQASDDPFIVLGDYVNQVIQIPYAQAGYYTYDKVISALDNLPGTDITTARGHTINSSDFDNWKDYSNGFQKINSQDEYIDMIMIIWRVNSQLSPGSSSGYVNVGSYTQSLKNKTGFNDYSEFVSHNSDAFKIMRHEFSHSLYGGNNFHTAGAGKGQRTFISSLGGYSNMSSWDNCSQSWNSWDRWRMGWKNSTKQHLISALDANNNNAEVNLESFSLQNNPNGGEYIIRDAGKTGDCIRIKLPYLTSPVANQYLWLENQAVLNRFNFSSSDRLGLYAYIQVGKDDKSFVNDYLPGNYLYFLPASGRHDFVYDFEQSMITVDPELQNPLTGYHFLMQHGLDTGNDGSIAGGTSELFLPQNVTIDGQTTTHYTTFGNSTDPFKLSGNSKLNISSNPTTATIQTYNFSSHDNSLESDNNVIFLNGLSVEILEENVDGDGAVKVKVRWDNFNIENDVRWTGNIKLSPNPFNPNPTTINPSYYALNVLGGKTVLLDRGLSPTREDNTGVDGNGKYLFTDPTNFTLLENSFMHLEENSNLIVDNGTTVTMENNTRLEVHSNSNVVVKNNSNLLVKAGSTLSLHPSANVIVESGSTITVEEGAIVYLGEAASFVVEETAKLIINSQNITLDGPTADFHIHGTLEVSDNATFQFQGAGFIQFFENCLVNMSANSTIRIIGSSKTDRKIRFNQNAEVIIPNGNLEFRNLKIIYETWSSLTQSSGTANFKYIHFDGNNNPFHYDGDDLSYFTLQNSTIDGGGNFGIKIKNASDFLSSIPIVRTNVFTDASFNVENFPEVNFFNNTFNNSSAEAVSIKDVNIVSSSMNKYQNSWIGILLENVTTSYFNGDQMKNNEYGIKGTLSNVFLRNSTKVFSNTYGVDLEGTPNFYSMLTCGDYGCVWINNNFTGVKGVNLLLNIDAQIHACNRGNCNDVIPNRFDGNTNYSFNICYDPNTTVTAINAKGNYWRSTLGVGSPPLSSNYKFSKVDSYNNCNNNIIPLIATNHALVLPYKCYPLIRVKNFILSQKQLAYADTVRMAINDIMPTWINVDSMLLTIPNIIPSCDMPYDQFDSTSESIGAHFTRGELNFLNSEYQQAMTLFTDIARIPLSESGNLTDQCRHLILVSEIMTRIVAIHKENEDLFNLNPSGMAIQTNSSSVSTSKLNKTPDKIIILPNPANKQISFFDKNNTLEHVRIHDLLGKEYFNGEYTTGMTVNIESWPSGIYLVDFISNDIKQTEKLFINK